jgi:hypothetical protein
MAGIRLRFYPATSPQRQVGSSYKYRLGLKLRATAEEAFSVLRTSCVLNQRAIRTNTARVEENIVVHQSSGVFHTNIT